MNVMRSVAVLVAVASASGHARQPSTLVAAVRAAIARQDFAEGERVVAASRATDGVTSLNLEALSWLGRGALAAGHIDKADAYGRQTYELALVELKRRRVDDDPRLAA